MNRHALLIAFTLVFTPSLVAAEQVAAEQPVPADHSSVHLVFVIPNSPSPKFDQNTTRTRIGNIVVPIQSVNPITIEIDGDFVGHALTGYHDVKPVFVLPSGTREFKFSCDGFQSTSMKIKLLGTGSKQYLVVKMKKEVDNATSKDRK